MDQIKIARTDETPEIDFDFPANRFAIRGESNPEDIYEFYGEPMDALHKHLAALDGGEMTFEFELIYFNSTSAKILFDLITALDAAAQRGVAVTVNWVYDIDDDVIAERGEEFAEEFDALTFSMIEKND